MVSSMRSKSVSSCLGHNLILCAEVHFTYVLVMLMSVWDYFLYED